MLVLVDVLPALKGENLRFATTAMRGALKLWTANSFCKTMAQAPLRYATAASPLVGPSQPRPELRLPAPSANLIAPTLFARSWAEFRRQLTYKAEWFGVQLVVVAPHYTSQTCPACGHVSAENRKTQAKFALLRRKRLRLRCKS